MRTVVQASLIATLALSPTVLAADVKPQPRRVLLKRHDQRRPPLAAWAP
jgi:hypothetical protein